MIKENGMINKKMYNKLRKMERMSSSAKVNHYTLVVERPLSSEGQSIKGIPNDPNVKETFSIPISISDDFFLIDANTTLHGITTLDEGLISKTPSSDADIVNKKYVDYQVSSKVSFDGNTVGGICTYKDADEIDVESMFRVDDSNEILYVTNGAVGGLDGTYFSAGKVSSTVASAKIWNPADKDDYFEIQTADAGVTTIKTIDSAADGADLTLDIDGDISLDSATGIFISKKDGTEFSPLNSAYSGMILGYSYYRNTDLVADDDKITISTTMAVLETVNGNKVKVVFKAPPSGNVEIIFSAMVYGSSKEVFFALSDNATFNELDPTHTYDGWSHKMDETDQNQVVIPFVVTGLTAGTEYTYYIGADSSAPSAYIYHGSNRTALHSPPIVVRAIALPTVITTGT